MKIVYSVDEVMEYRRANKQKNIGFVPTMGALHDGHLSLISASKKDNDLSALSIFVNPTQFGANEDFSKYPRVVEKDLELAKNAGVDLVFLPSADEIYKNDDEITINPPKSMGYILEGFYRDGHFGGVLQVVLKLLHIFSPQNAYFGKKDAQQLLLIQRLVKDTFLDCNIVGCPIKRDSDGLALSSRNIYLSAQQRQEALKIPQTLGLIEKHIKDGVFDITKLKDIAIKSLEGLDVEYLSFCDENLREVESISQTQTTIILLTAKVGNTRLLDNLWIQK